ncbi:MAG: protein O-mannosyl-transferase [Blastocatellia bacterium]|jgi:Flp pilus assembly protein TadD|nr:protein O-mannosyl-transferase [Blastocatellia bacterium]
MAKKRSKREAARPDAKRPGRAEARVTQGQSFFSRNHDEILICLSLAIVTAVVYWQLGEHQFINLDDDVYVYENSAVRAGLTARGFAWAFTTFNAANWHPLTWLSHMLDVQLFGLNAGSHLYTNLFLHILNALLLFGLLRRMTGHVWRSAMVAALFALHPLRVESVAWVSERKDVLSTLFWMLALWAYARYTEQPKSLGRYLLVVVALALGLMAKPMLVTLPFVLLLLDYWPLNRLRWRAADGGKALLAQAWPLIREKLPLFALVAASGIVTYFAQQHGGAVKTLTRFPLSLRLSNSLVAYTSYLGKMLWPDKLAVYYPYELSRPAWQTIGAALVLIGVTALALYSARRRGYMLTGWLWFLGSLVPVIGLVQVGEQSLADRYTYVPLIGVFVMLVWGAADVIKSWSFHRVAASVAAGVLLTALCVLTWRQAGRWRDNVTLYEHTLGVTSNNYVINNNLGFALSKTGRRAEGIEHLNEALRIKPDFFEAHNSLGAALTEEKRFAEALEHFEEAARLQPEVAKVHSNMGAALGSMNRLDEAVAQLNEALRLDPDYPNTHLNLGLIYLRQGKNEEAAARLAEAAQLQPDSAETHNAYGYALGALGKLEEAIAQFKIALSLKPDYAQAQNNLRNAQSLLDRQPK